MSKPNSIYQIKKPSDESIVFCGTIDFFAEQYDVLVINEQEFVNAVEDIFGDVYITKLHGDQDGTMAQAISMVMNDEAFDGIVSAEDLDGKFDPTIDYDSVIEQDLEAFNKRSGSTFKMTLDIIKAEPTMYAAMKLAIHVDMLLARHATKH